MLRRVWLSAIALLWLAGSSVASPPKRVALVVGNSAYQHTSRLINPKNDASDVAAVLRSFGFQVIEGFDLDKAKMDGIVRNFAEALSNANLGLFFYAGHGLQVSGENYLVPVDAQLSTAAALDFEMLRLALVQRVMERATEANVIFLDACRDNPLARNLARAMGTRSGSVGRGLAAMESGVGTLISFSTQPGNVALDGTGRNSPFASALIEKLGTSRDDLSTILIDVRNKVIAATGSRQVPWEHSALRARIFLHGAALTDASPSAPPSLSPAAQAWAAVKDSRSPAVFRAFADSYRGTIYAALAEARLKEMEEQSVPRTADGPSSELAKALQQELRRVGCFSEAVDGVWGPASRSALADFNSHAKMALSTDAPAETSLSVLRSIVARICPESAPPKPRTTGATAGAGTNCRKETVGECRYRVCPAGRGCGLRGSGICSEPRRRTICN